MNKIPASEFKMRIDKLKSSMKKENLDVCFVYGDEYRRENLRYVSNYWALFERGALIVPLEGEPILLAAPEGEKICSEMSAWPDIRVIPDFACVTVPEEIEYPQADYTDFNKVFAELRLKQSLQRVGIIGLDAMSHIVYLSIANCLKGSELVDASHLLYESRLIKSEFEIACLKEAGRIADAGYKALLIAAAPGKTELELAAAAHEAAFREGAETIPFCLVSSGERVHTIIGRATNKVIADGEMVMAALSVQYEGYIATINFPFVVGAMTEDQGKFISLLIVANELAKSKLQPGASLADLVKTVKDYFRMQNVSPYDLYPPLHGCGVAEAELPYPNEASEGEFVPGMTVNTDISLFGHPAGSNRIEEGFVVTAQGNESLSVLIGELCKQWKEHGSIDPLNMK
ncbi:peptidase M24 [Paenibacillus baekrokdamisoli]|uniref:Peptidase M24 n=1 Tax=Paenibacillus baekrokdamisoli TaxID=1712516 RepID=A0A3G9J7F1_9BACL|nr:M24 family metallopeptidase [Paenibacillus baekrokdamisoli]MBB3067080.1 Xaa-Pro aminopeptidase [Paenibacillus baekrokdamisoli]BBH19728.1 peptidase M24 [Paenibacillus baekrokdamisoli]